MKQEDDGDIRIATLASITKNADPHVCLHFLGAFDECYFPTAQGFFVTREWHRIVVGMRHDDA